MAIRRFTIETLAMFFAVACVGLAGCVSGPPARAAKPDFNGDWSVKWCDRTNPALDCGGFSVTLVQEGDRICGDFGGALVNLRQIDDGSVIGAAVGNTAVMAVESYRNGSIALVRATLEGSELHWREVDSIRRGGTDIAIIATNDVLVKSEETPSPPHERQGEEAKGARPCP
ncbi:hypothetical protein [Pseudoxanthomonas sp. PXM02]|uniref:hypothetical protein n=1 Tax=Pseudoxanthomonas sp. PXM02 TaxID=2769294 RepID=UPI0017825641|nr:hypothetical protein [Pseudoxanthomonas sp. PXM02]MBD9478859.1 hypothetical protein [Pseudoxanthomonas sp. PXM02]